jgi:hypothetical protein
LASDGGERNQDSKKAARLRKDYDPPPLQEVIPTLSTITQAKAAQDVGIRKLVGLPMSPFDKPAVERDEWQKQFLVILCTRRGRSSRNTIVTSQCASWVHIAQNLGRRIGKTSWLGQLEIVSGTPYHSFAGDAEASNTSTMRCLTPSCRHQLSLIDRNEGLGISADNSLPNGLIQAAERFYLHCIAVFTVGIIEHEIITGEILGGSFLGLNCAWFGGHYRPNGSHFFVQSWRDQLVGTLERFCVDCVDVSLIVYNPVSPFATLGATPFQVREPIRIEVQAYGDYQSPLSPSVLLHS